MNLRIGLIVYGDLDQRTGGNIYDRELLRGLVALGAAGIELSLRDPNGGTYGRSVQEIVAQIRHERCDVLLQDELCHSELNELNAALSAEDFSLRFAIVHNLGFRDVAPEWRDDCRESERRLISQVDGCIVNSRFTLGEVEALVGRTPPHVMAYPSVGPDFLRDGDDEAGDTAGLRRDSVRLLSVANLGAVKGVHLLLDALASLRTHRWTLDLVGSTTRDHRYVRTLVEQIEATGLTGRVRIHGELRGRELRAAYRAADIFVLPSPREGFGIACLEAMKCGLPVIVSSIGAAPELVADGRHGFLVDPTDRGALVSTLRRAFSEPGSLARMGHAARRRAMSHPTWESAAGQVARFLRARHEARIAYTSPERPSEG